MKCLVIRLSALLITIPTLAMASWQVADTAASPGNRFKSGVQTNRNVSPTVASRWEEPRRPVAIPAEPFFQTGVKQHIQSYGGTIPAGAEVTQATWHETGDSVVIESEPHFSASGRETTPLPYPAYHNQPTYVSSVSTTTTTSTPRYPSTWGTTKPTRSYDVKQESLGCNVNRHEAIAAVPYRYNQYNRNAYFAEHRYVPAEYAISVSGSLKDNLVRIMNRYHWKVIWKAPYDYNFDGRVTGKSLPNVVEKLLRPFPLQAVMYMSNRTMTVVPRKV